MVYSKTVEPIEMPFGELTHVVPRTYGVKVDESIRDARVTGRRCGLLSEFSDHLLYFCVRWPA